jgi:hypothetical protein
MERAGSKTRGSRTRHPCRERSKHAQRRVHSTRGPRQALPHPRLQVSIHPLMLPAIEPRPPLPVSANPPAHQAFEHLPPRLVPASLPAHRRWLSLLVSNSLRVHPAIWPRPSLALPGSLPVPPVIASSPPSLRVSGNLHVHQAIASRPSRVLFDNLPVRPAIAHARWLPAAYNTPGLAAWHNHPVHQAYKKLSPPPTPTIHRVQQARLDQVHERCRMRRLQGL